MLAIDRNCAREFNHDSPLVLPAFFFRVESSARHDTGASMPSCEPTFYRVKLPIVSADPPYNIFLTNFAVLVFGACDCKFISEQRRQSIYRSCEFNRAQ